MKEVTSNQIDDAKAVFTRGFRKSLKKCNKEAKHFARSFTDFVDFEDILKSIHKAARPQQHFQRASSVYHSPIDWSKYPSSAFNEYPDDTSEADEENRTGGEGVNGVEEEMGSRAGTSEHIETPKKDHNKTAKKIKL